MIFTFGERVHSNIHHVNYDITQMCRCNVN